MVDISQWLSCIFLSHPFWYVDNVGLVSYKFTVFHYKADFSMLEKFWLLLSAPFLRLQYLKLNWNQLTHQRAKMRMIRWMCGRQFTMSCTELRERPGIDDIMTVVQRHMLRGMGTFYERTRMTGWKCIFYPLSIAAWTKLEKAVILTA